MDDFANQMCGPFIEDYPSAQKVRMNRDIHMGKHLARALYIQNRDQPTNTET